MPSATARARLGRVVPVSDALTTRPQPLHNAVALLDLGCSPTKLSIATSEKLWIIPCPSATQTSPYCVRST